MILNKHESDSGSEQNIGSSCCLNVATLFKFQASLWNLHLCKFVKFMFSKNAETICDIKAKVGDFVKLLLPSKKA